MNDNQAGDSSTERLITILLTVAVVLGLLSIFTIWLITRNAYAASYYTISSLFDANSEGASGYIAAVLSTNSYAFYEFITVSVLDGIAKAVLIGFLIASFINLLSGVDIQSKLGLNAPKNLKGHVIVCGYSMLGEMLCQDLREERQDVIVIDKSQDKINMMHDLGLQVFEGDFTTEEVLKAASIGTAKAIIFATESDFVNLLGVVTARHIAPDLNIIARSRDESSVRKMQRGGARLCLVPEIVAGLNLGERVSK